MAFRVLRLLQIGDVHQPDWPLEREGRDVKTALQSKFFSDSLGHYRIERVLSAMLNVRTSTSFDAVVFVGDFTTRGDVKGLATSVAQMAALFSPELGTASRLPIIAVPGNHDVNKDDATKLGMTGKFDTIEKLTRQSGWQNIPTDSAPYTNINEGDAHLARIYMLNTCMGSWELAAFGKSTVSTLKKLRAIATSSALGIPEESFSGKKISAENLQYDNYDAPFVNQNALSSMVDGIRNLSSNTAIVVVGHHNILQQQIPRYAPFAELLNAGSIRRSLQRHSRPAIYLHGHIHEGPIETIIDAEDPKNLIVSISAPELAQGFNVVEIHIPEDAPPLGVTVRRYRWQPNGDVREEMPVRIPLNPTQHKSRVLKREADVLGILDDEGVIKFSHLLDHRTFSGTNLSEKILERLIISLYWRDLLDVENLSKPCRDWRIKAIGQ